MPIIHQLYRRRPLPIRLSHYTLLTTLMSIFHHPIPILLPLPQRPILPLRLLNLTSLLLPRRLRLQRNPTLIPLLLRLNLIRQQLARDLLVLRTRPGGLAFDYHAGGFVDDLDGGVGFVLGIVVISFGGCCLRYLRKEGSSFPGCDCVQFSVRLALCL